MQQSFFDEPVADLISIDEAAENAKVSSATIRNWIKTGVLTLESKGLISRDSVVALLEGRTGPKKLTQRANKSQKDVHDHDSLSYDFMKLLSGSTINAAELSDHYETGLSESFRNKEGIYYTPEALVADLLRRDGTEGADLTFLDPCCGSGALPP
jgi:site-specific DNA-methyltransferase (adenine-specific)